MDVFNFTGTETKAVHYLKCVYLLPICWAIWIIFQIFVWLILAPLVFLRDSFLNGVPEAAADVKEALGESLYDTCELWQCTWAAIVRSGFDVQ